MIMNKKDEHFVNKSNTEGASKDTWQTPIPLFIALDQEFNFELDACASIDNALCINWFTEGVSSLTNEWSSKDCDIRSAFMNPPYSQTELFLNRAADQANKHNITVVALVNANTDTKWFANAVKSANEIRLIRGRIGFVGEAGKKVNGNTKGQCLIIWRGNCKTPCNIVMVNRDELIGGNNG